MAVKSPPKPPARQPRPPQNAPRITRPKPPRNNERFAHDLWGVGLVAFGLMLLVSLILQGRAGALGDALAGGLRSVFGIGAFVVPFLVGTVGVSLIVGRSPQTRANFGGGATLLFLVFIAWWQLAHSTHEAPLANADKYGGLVGGFISSALRALVGDISSHIILLALTFVGVLWVTDMRLLHLFDHAVEGTRKVTAPVAEGARAGAQMAKQGAQAVKEKAARIAPTPPPSGTPPPSERERGQGQESLSASPTGQGPESMLAPRNAKPAMSGSHWPLSLSEGGGVPDEGGVGATLVTRKGFLTPDGPDIDEDMPTVPKAMPALALPPVETAKPKPQGPLTIPDSLGNDGTKHEFVLPPLELLNESPPKPVKLESAVQEKQAVLMQTLNDFKIGANVSKISIGPTVTRYEVQLEPGILVKKIVSLADNLAMSLAAIDVRVEAPIPGKSAIGIEVPNDITQMVSLRECLATNEFMNAPSKLTFCLGKDVSGEYKYADLARMPHLLVGGSTNSGKSVCLNIIISSLLYRATPREVKFVMIDPKRVELSLYDGIPHLLSPVIKNVKQAAGIFRSVLKEMEDRYDKFARIGTRNLEGYNSRVTPEERLPFIVVVVDELADLMMQQGPEVETSICRLAQLARATGIHLIIATQRPSVDVITGTIKANISSRIAFAVATQVDSRTIIDMPGADRLIGRGDMLFMPIDAAKPVRIQGCYVGERETESLVKYLNEQEAPKYTMIPSEAGDGMGSGDMEDDGSSDELFEPCVRWLVLQGQCSTSSLQRKFKIGYTRAARLVEIMEARGIVGSQDGVKPREILLQRENVDVFFAGHENGDLGQ
jgi:S-DNA-T family DNA segregation ATPase FtsK/SpoIIIE